MTRPISAYRSSCAPHSPSTSLDQLSIGIGLALSIGTRRGMGLDVQPIFSPDVRVPSSLQFSLLCLSNASVFESQPTVGKSNIAHPPHLSPITFKRSSLVYGTALPSLQAFHGEKELFNSDHPDQCDIQTVLGKCHVMTLRKYQELDPVGDHDYFTRFTYKVCTLVSGQHDRKVASYKMEDDPFLIFPLASICVFRMARFMLLTAVGHSAALCNSFRCRDYDTLAMVVHDVV